MEKKISMVKAASAAISIKRNNPSWDNEKIMEKIMPLLSEEKNEHTRLGMIAAASKAIDIAERNPRLTEKETVRKILAEFNSILENIGPENNKV